MSVIGIDFGNESCYVATAKDGGIETLANDYSLRATPSFVAFAGRKRILGVAAKNQQLTNLMNTVFGFKRLLGRKYNDPHVKKELEHIPFKIEERADGKIGIFVNYLGKEQSFTPEQITAMLFTKLKETSEHATQTQVHDCVIACPVYFTHIERKAVLEAAYIAKLNVIRLMNETTATALFYGFYQPDLSDEKPRTVVFVDCGQSSLQVSSCLFSKGRLKMLASNWDQVGGRDFDLAMALHFAEEFKQRFKIDVRNNKRAMLRLLCECEKLKRQMSANSTKLPLNVECLLDDIDVSSSMQRAEMEELCAPIMKRIEHTFQQFLMQSKLELDDISAVEIVGGTSRIPYIKQLIEQVFGQAASTTLNQDESVSRGAALQCAIMSPAVRVRDFGVTDLLSYAVKVGWESNGFFEAGEIEVFPKFHSAPFSRLLTLNRKEPFTLTVEYAEPVPHSDQVIGKWRIHVPNDEKDYQEVKIKVRINQHGLVFISNATAIDRKEAEEANELPEHKPNAIEGEKKKKSTRGIDLQVDCITESATIEEEISKLVQQEVSMVKNDATEILRVDAKNTLEELIYEIRNKLNDALSGYVTEKDKAEISSELEFLENWLYEDGEDCEREVYVKKHNALVDRIEPISQRQTEFQRIPVSFKKLEKTISSVFEMIEERQKFGIKYAHITREDLEKLRDAANKELDWMSNSMARYKLIQPTMEPTVKFSEIEQRNTALLQLLQNTIKGNNTKVNSEQHNGKSERTGNNAAKQSHPDDMEVD